MKTKKQVSKKVIKHLKGDIETFKHEAAEDKKLVKELKSKKKTSKKKSKKTKTAKSATAKSKFKKVMHEFGKGELHSGSKKGPVVTNPKQALAISFSESRRSKKK